MANFREYLQQTAPTQVDEMDAKSMAYNLLKQQAGAGGPVTAQGVLPQAALNQPGLPAGPVNLFKEENLTPFLQALGSTKQGLTQDNALNAAKFAINYWKGFNSDAEAEYGNTPGQTPGSGGQTPGTGNTTPQPGDWNYVSSYWTPAKMNQTLYDLQQANNNPAYFQGISGIMNNQDIDDPTRQQQLNTYFAARPWLRTYYGGVPSVAAFKLSGYY